MRVMTLRRRRYLAELCEHATGDIRRCRCRCSGLLHGMEHPSEWIQDCVDADWFAAQAERDSASRDAGQRELFA